jgi:peptide/nickel transport system ATP-binding protein
MTHERKPILEIEGLQISLPQGADRPHALSDFNLTVGEGEIVCLVGESGSGKSLAANAVMRLLPGPDVRVSKGVIRLNGKDILSLSEKSMRAIRGDRLAMIFQEPMTALNPQKTVGWQIDEALRLHTKLGRAERKARALEILADVHIPDPASAYNAYAHQISGGQRQRVMIAMALVLKPRLIIADEPTTALDVTTQKQILKLIKDLQSADGTGVLFITHDFGVVAEIADRIAVLCLGEIVEQGTASQILKDPQHPYTRKLIASVPGLVPPPEKPLSSQPVVLEVRDLNKTFAARGSFLFGKRNRVAAVKNLSFQLRRGETLGVVGESGSGKTTVARIVTRLLEADDGEVRILGRDLMSASKSEVRGLRKDIQMVFQDPMASLNPRRRVIELIAQGPIVQGIARDVAYARARQLLSMVELPPAAAERYPHEFSGGQRQRIGIARALAMDPQIIVADEPVSALDVSVQAQVLRLLVELRDRLHLSLLFVTHDLRVAAQLCDKVIVMSRGEIVEAGPTAQIFASPTHPYARALLNSIPGRDWEPPAAAGQASLLAGRAEGSMRF